MARFLKQIALVLLTVTVCVGIGGAPTVKASPKRARAQLYDRKVSSRFQSPSPTARDLTPDPSRARTQLYDRKVSSRFQSPSPTARDLTPDPSRLSSRAVSVLLRKKGEILAGDLFKNHKGKLMIAIEPDELVLMPSVNNILTSTFVPVTIYVKDLMKFWSKSHKMTPRSDMNYDADITIAMAKTLQNKVLPYHFIYCKVNNYENYILYGQPHRTEKFGCPLAAPLGDVTPVEILDGDFVFQDVRGEEYEFPEYVPNTCLSLLKKIVP